MPDVGIYSFINKLNNLRYIGQSRHISKRKLEHLRDDVKLKTLFGEALREFGTNAFEFEVLENCELEQLNEKEQYWISYYDSYSHGYNMTPGGRDVVDYEKTRAISMNEIKSSWEDGLCLCDIREKYKCSSSAAIKNQLHLLGVPDLEIINRGEQKKKKQKRCKKIVQLTLDNKKVAEYVSINEASRVTGIESRNIGKVCRKERNHAGNFKWEYLEESN